MKLPTKTHYAILAMIALAAKETQAAPINLRVIAEENGIPLPFLTQIMQQLRVAGLVRSIRGPSGGYRLGRPATKISLGDVIESVSTDPCYEERCCESPAANVLADLWQGIERDFRDRLRSVSLSDLAQQCVECSEGELRSMMFYI